MTTLLEARHVTKLFSSGLLDRHATVALEDFSLAIDSENPTARQGRSGKTTCAGAAWRRQHVGRFSIRGKTCKTWRTQRGAPFAAMYK